MHLDYHFHYGEFKTFINHNNSISFLIFVFGQKVSIRLEKFIWIFDGNDSTINFGLLFTLLLVFRYYTCARSFFSNNFNYSMFGKWFDINRQNDKKVQKIHKIQKTQNVQIRYFQTDLRIYLRTFKHKTVKFIWRQNLKYKWFVVIQMSFLD